MKILVTGATGFLGRHILDALSLQSGEILAISRSPTENFGRWPQVRWLRADLGNVGTYARQVKAFKPEIVIHLAWDGIPDYSEAVSRRNIELSLSFLGFIDKCISFRRLIVSGSCMECTADQVTDVPVHVGKPDNYFVLAKEQIRAYAAEICTKKEKELVWFRVFYVYGEGQRRGALMPTIVDALRRGDPLPISKPYNRNDFIYVKDVANAFAKASYIEEQVTGIFDLGSGILHRVIDVCGVVESELSGGRVEQTSKLIQEFSRARIWTEAGQAAVEWRADPAPTGLKLAWREKWTLQQGVRDLLHE